jgi:DNA-binding transcriptional LysR family regulator
MELRQLRYFVGVARELNFTRAAAKLRVAQPALSRQIHQLEEEVGVTLLDRGARGVQLTEAGAVFLAEAAAVLEQSEQAVRRTQLSSQRQQTQLNVGYVWGLFHTLVPQWIARFRQRNPEVAVNLFDLTATQQAEALGRGKLDLGFIGFAFEADAARLAKQRVGRCAFMAALPEKHPAATKRKVPLAALAQDFFIVISEQTYPGAARFLTDACRRAGFRPKILQTAERGYTILGLVAGNCGVTLLPESLQALPHPGVVFRPLADAPSGDLFVAWNPAIGSAATESFVASLTAAEKK